MIGAAKCRVKVSDHTGYHFSPCGANAKVERAGVPYCGRHDPERGPNAAQIAAAERRACRAAGHEADRLAAKIANACASGKAPSESTLEKYRQAMRAAGRAW